MQKNNQKKSTLTRRAFFLSGLQTIAIAGLMSRFYFLQIKEQDYYKTMSDKNRIRTSIIPPIRGNIIDCNGIELVHNNTVHCLIIKQEFTNQVSDLVKYIENILGYQTDISRQGIERTLKISIYNKLPIIVQNALSWQDITQIESNIWRIQNKVEIIQSHKRTYIKGALFGHITGYVARPSLEEAKKNTIPNYRDFEIGKNGVEKTFETILQGKAGIRSYEADAHDRLVREMSLTKPKQGQNVTLSIDSNIQQIIAEIMDGQSGTVALANVKDCTLAGLYSSPSYDPNNFIGGIKSNLWQNLLEDPNKPLINKAISSSYPPGSIFKMVTALAILMQGISTDATIVCNGEFTLGNQTYHCWNSYGHGVVNWHDAVAKSCNVYFYTYGLKIGIKSIAKIGHLLGLGQKTGIELPSEQSGVLPDHLWKKNKLKQNWYPGDTVNASIGQGFILTTPIQLITMLLRILHGKFIRPSIICKNNHSAEIISQTKNDNVSIFEEYLTNKEDEFLPIHSQYLDMLKHNLYRVFNSPGGTGYRHRLETLSIAGKTGTAQVISQRKVQNKANLEHGLFAGFAPYENPKYAISVIIEHGGWGSQSALPVGKKILDRLLNG